MQEEVVVSTEQWWDKKHSFLEIKGKRKKCPNEQRSLIVVWFKQVATVQQQPMASSWLRDLGPLASQNCKHKLGRPSLNWPIAHSFLLLCNTTS